MTDRERVAMAIFGCWRQRPRLPDAEIEKAWNSMDDAFKAPWLEAADHAIDTVYAAERGR